MAVGNITPYNPGLLGYVQVLGKSKQNAAVDPTDPAVINQKYKSSLYGATDRELEILLVHMHKLVGNNQHHTDQRGPICQNSIFNVWQFLRVFNEVKNRAQNPKFARCRDHLDLIESILIKAGERGIAPHIVESVDSQLKCLMQDVSRQNSNGFGHPPAKAPIHF